MNKALTALQSIKPSRRTVYIVAGTLLLLSLFIVGMITQVRAERHAKAEAAQVAAQQAEEKQATQARIAELEAENKTLQADKKAGCTYIRTLVTARNTRGLVVEPTAMHCPK